MHVRFDSRTLFGVMAHFYCVALVVGFTAMANGERPNVVFFVVDNVNFEHMGGCYKGYGHTPNLDRLASRGVTFDRAYATTALCVTSRYTCLTGRYASRCTSKSVGKHNPAGEYWTGAGVELEAERANIGNVMQRAGYRTGFVGKYHLKHDELGKPLTNDYPKTKLGKFDGKDPRVIANLRGKHDEMRKLITARGFDYADRFTCYRSLKTVNVDYYGAEHNVEWELEGALDFVDQEDERPFMLYWASSMAHLAIDVDVLLKDPEAIRMTKMGQLPNDQTPKVPMPSRADILKVATAGEVPAGERKFRAGMAWLDAAFGALVNRLEEKKMLDNTLILVFSDNTIDGGKDTVYEDGARVPCLAAWPGRIPAGTRCSQLVANVDFASTIFDAAGAGFDFAEHDGESLLPMLAGKTKNWRQSLVLESGYTKAVVTNRWKYVAVRYPEETRGKISEWDKNGSTLGDDYKMNARSLAFAKKSIAALPAPVRGLAGNQYRWHKGGNNYLKSIKNHPTQFATDQLYDLSQDYHEQRDVASVNPEKIESMKTLLKRGCVEQKRPFGEFSE